MAGQPLWHALWTHSHCERLVYEQLKSKGFEPFLPTLVSWKRGREGHKSLAPVAMFPGYLFVRHAIDKTGYVEILKSRGLVRILGTRWDRPAIIPDEEIDGIRRLCDSGLPALPYPYLREGRRMRITAGPLANVEGIVLRTDPDKGLLVLSVELLRRSVAVEVDCTQVAVT